MQHLLLLHGAIGAKDQLLSLEKELSGHFIVHVLNFSGHGGEAFAVEPFSIALFAGEITAYLSARNIEQANIFGYSMGGYAALYAARHFPEKISRVITLATKFHWDEATAAKEAGMLNAEKIEEKLPAFAKDLQQRHRPNDWKTVLQKTAAMLTGMGHTNPLQPDDYSSIQQPVLIMLGDRDKMVTLEETVAVFRALPKGELAVLPATPHPIEKTDIGMLAGHITRFCM